jgi:hypothetical protein
MRTTLTLDPDVERLISEEVHRTRRPFKQVVNDAIRAGLGSAALSVPPEKFEVRAHPCGLRPGVDPTRLNQLLDELEAEEVAVKLRKRGKQTLR